MDKESNVATAAPYAVNPYNALSEVYDKVMPESWINEEITKTVGQGTA